MKGILLMNLGSPDSTDTKDVRRYLNEFLMDEKVIDVNYLLRLFLVKGIIVPFRAPKSAHAYKTIWTKEGSPLTVLTKQLQQAVEQKINLPVEIAMRYGNPHPARAFEQLMKRVNGLDEVILFPLYPHYAMSSYETAVEYAQKIHQQKKYPFKLTVVEPYYNNAHYIHALAESIKPFLQNGFDKLLFSYHGVPERHIKKGDTTKQHCLQVNDCCNVSSQAHAKCYRHQTFVTTNLVTEELNLPEEKFEQTFQSRLGKDEWLKPYTAKRLEALPKEGIKKVVVVCPAFVSDCLETLEEIAIQGKEIFLNAGGESYTVVPCLNVNSLWVDVVIKLMNEKMGDRS